MAASDPTAGVATPTGVLQGVAAFSWDGTTWQPSGRASVGVGTPTGVLRGVAPFSWSGSAWAPAAVSVPDIATPGGALDGVAVYTWSGSAWTPAGGGPDAATPSGVLQGVAAFNWDGTAWQPAGQAGPDVATPAGVLQGVAMFSWNGSAWAPSVSAPALDLNFITMSILNPSVTFTRASTATYFDNTGTMQTAGNNAPRLDYDPVTHAPRGLLVEESRTNLALQSANLAAAPWSVANITVAAPVVTANQATAPDGTLSAASVVLPAVSGAGNASILYQQVLVTAAAYVFSIYLRGAVGGEQLYFGASNSPTFYTAARVTLTRNWQRFTFTTPALTAIQWFFYLGADLRDGGQAATSAQTIYAWGAQVELGAFPTSYVATTATAVTRQADTATIASIPGRNTAAETFAADVMLITNQNVSNRILGSATSAAGMIFMQSNFQFGTYDTATLVTTPNTYSPGSVGKAAATWTSPNGSICLNGGTPVISGGFTTGYAPVTTVKLMGDSAAAEQSNGYIRRFRYWPRVLAFAELQQVTT